MFKMPYVGTLTKSRPTTHRVSPCEGAIVPYEVKARSVEWNPTAARLRELTEKMPNSRLTEVGNAVVKARADTTVVYTPNLPMEGYPNDRLIAVDLNANITRVFNSDYFGESKKGGLRMWNNIVYERGGLSLHAGCKVIPVGGDNKTVLIVGLSGTGKTTTTFTTQLGSKPVQDDFLALMPEGRVYTTENGCFAKTFGLDPKFEPT